MDIRNFLKRQKIKDCAETIVVESAQLNYTSASSSSITAITLNQVQHHAKLHLQIPLKLNPA